MYPAGGGRAEWGGWVGVYPTGGGRAGDCWGRAEFGGWVVRGWDSRC